MSTTITTHKWQEAGLGTAPFSVVTVITMPSRALQEHNTTAYNNALRDASLQADKFGVSLCTCDVCGQSLQNNFVVRDAHNKFFVVGCDCARKTGDTQVMTQAELLEKRRKRAMNDEKRRIAFEKRVAKREAQLQKEREANGGLTDHEIQLQKEEEEREQRLASRMEKVGFIVERLMALNTDFHTSLANQLRERNLSDRQADFVCKAMSDTGRWNKKNEDELNEIFDLCTGQS